MGTLFQALDKENSENRGPSQAGYAAPGVELADRWEITASNQEPEGDAWFRRLLRSTGKKWQKHPVRQTRDGVFFVTGRRKQRRCSAHAVDVVTAVRALDQAMDIGLEAGEGGVEFAGEFEIAADRPVEPLAGNQ